MRLLDVSILVVLSTTIVGCCCSRFIERPVKSFSPSFTNQNKSPHKTAVLVHGLNTIPEVMNDIADVLTHDGYAVITITLPGHGDSQEVSDPTKAWTTTVLDGVREGRAMAGVSELLLVGYSLGGALAVLASVHPAAPTIDRMVLIAPALGIRIPLPLLRIGNLPAVGRFPIHSIAPPNLRRWCSIPLKWYGAIPKILDQIDLHHQSGKLQKIPTRVVLNPRDEIISLEETKHWLLEHSLKEHWSLKTISPESPSGENFEHNMVGRAALGEQTWSELSNIVRQ